MYIPELLIGKHIGLGDAHPDDHVTATHVLRLARRLGKTVREITYTKGRESELNYKGSGFSVTAGQRAEEAEKAIDVLGLDDYSIHDGSDGDLRSEIATYTPITADWIRAHQLDVLITLGLDDHPDHLASALIGRLAAQQVYEQDGHPVDVLELQMRPVPGSMRVEATPDGMEQAFAVLKAHGSQFLLSDEPQPGWPIVPGGSFMHPESFADIRRYPVMHDLYVMHYPAGSLALVNATQIALTTQS